MRGLYCLVLGVPSAARVPVGALGVRDVPAGVYVYVGSAQGGIEARVDRHRSEEKTLQWHIDYLLKHGEVISSIAIPLGSKEQECETLRLISSCEEAEIPVPGFGSSDCDCPSHLVYFGDEAPERVVDLVLERVSMMGDVYPAVMSRPSE